MTIKEKKKVLFSLFLIIVVSVILSLWGSKIDIGLIVSQVQKAGIWAPIVYVIALTIPAVIAPLSGAPIYIAGYVMFGAKVQLYAYLVSIFSSVSNFFIARKWGRRWVEKMVGRDDMEKIDSFTKDYGLFSLIFLRIFQGYLHDFISYAYGLTNMKFLPYMIVNILAPIPWLLLWQFYIFPRVKNLADFTVIFWVSFVPFLIISWFYWRYKNGKK